MEVKVIGGTLFRSTANGDIRLKCPWSHSVTFYCGNHCPQFEIESEELVTLNCTGVEHDLVKDYE